MLAAGAGRECRRMDSELESFHLVNWRDREGFRILFQLTLNLRAQPSPHETLASSHLLKVTPPPPHLPT